MKNLFKINDPELITKIERYVDLVFSFIPQRKPKKIATHNVRLIAHRGAHENDGKRFENTNAAFQRAVELGCWGIEFDIHSSADKILLVNHDPDLMRLWNKSFVIGKTHFKTIRQHCPDIPTLEEVISKFGKKIHLYIELKAPFTAYAELAKSLKDLIPGEDFHIISLDSTQLLACKDFPQESLLLIPGHDNVTTFCNLSLEKSLGGVLGHYFLLRNKHVRALKNANQIIGVGFIDSRNLLYRELNRGVQYLFTNKAELVTKIFNKLCR